MLVTVVVLCVLARLRISILFIHILLCPLFHGKSIIYLLFRLTFRHLFLFSHHRLQFLSTELQRNLFLSVA